MESRSRGATLKDVARRAGVSTATASRALDPTRGGMVNDETRQRVQGAAEAIGYRINSFARSLRTNSSGMVGVVVADVANPFLPPMLRGIEKVLRAEGHLLLIAETHDDSATLDEIVDHLSSRRVDAVILSAAHVGDQRTVTELNNMIPLVLAVRSVPATKVPTVTHDDHLGGQLAAQHLVDLGHQVLVQLRGPQDVSSFQDRAAGFRSVMATTAAREVPLDAVAASPTAEEGYELTLRALEIASSNGTDAPTAIFAHNDLMAVGALDAVRSVGLSCPTDVSIVGYNDAPLSNHVSPSLTTVALPSLELGERAAQMALDAIAGIEHRGDVVRLPPALVVRDSTTAIPR